MSSSREERIRRSQEQLEAQEEIHKEIKKLKQDEQARFGQAWSKLAEFTEQLVKDLNSPSSRFQFKVEREDSANPNPRIIVTLRQPMNREMTIQKLSRMSQDKGYRVKIACKNPVREDVAGFVPEMCFDPNDVSNWPWQSEDKQRRFDENSFYAYFDMIFGTALSE